MTTYCVKTPVMHTVLNVRAFNQEKALVVVVGAFSVIVKLQTSRRFVASSRRLTLRTMASQHLRLASFFPLAMPQVTMTSSLFWGPMVRE